MKRLSKKQRERHRRHEKTLERIRRKTRIKKNARKRARRKWASKPQQRIPTVRVRAPEIFSIETERDRDALVTFLETLRQHYKTFRGKLVVDFSHTHRFIAHGTLMFY